MSILLLFAFISGLVTILAPCIWPLLPIVLSSTVDGGKRKPLGITLGIVVTFALFTLSISYIVKIIPFDPNILRLFAVIVIGFLGLTLVIPRLTQLLEGWVSRFSGTFARFTKPKDQGFISGLITGCALGVVWSPCAGPILATIATLAATQSVNLAIILVTIVYVTGVGIPLFFFTTVGSRILKQSRVISKHTMLVQRVFGTIMVLTALAIYTNYDKVIQVKLLDLFPSYSNILTQLESNDAVQDQLDSLRGNTSSNFEPMNPNIIMTTPGSALPNLGPAPEFVGITRWLNLPDGEKDLTMQKLRGKVVLIDFWTYTCINCIRTLPFVTGWYEKYKGEGFVVVGVHTPEFEFEKNTNNVLAAIKQYNITYPVAQDNNYDTWNAYSNRYWPAHYLIDASGNIRKTHFGEGQYDEMEMAIKTLLEEAGKKVSPDVMHLPDETPRMPLTPETYLGTDRMSFTDSLKFSGKWDRTEEYSSSHRGSLLELKFYANKVYLVITPDTMRDIIKVYLDGKLVGPEVEGADVKNGFIQIQTNSLDNLYNLIDLRGNPGEHLLRLEFGTDGTQIYAFTFG